MVFPARAGMNPMIDGGPLATRGVPRACGDEPEAICGPPPTNEFPRACGDEPMLGTLLTAGALCSPRVRG